MAKHQTKILKFLVQQHKPTRPEICTLGPVASIRLNVQNSWCTSRGQQGQKFGHWDLWQALD